jgi:hypothetical protein
MNSSWHRARMWDVGPLPLVGCIYIALGCPGTLLTWLTLKSEIHLLLPSKC